MEPVPDDVDTALADIEAAIARHLSAKPLAGWARLTKLRIELFLRNWVRLTNRLLELDARQRKQQAFRRPCRIR